MEDHDFSNILAVDTATQRLNLALFFDGDRSVQSREEVLRTHGQVLLKKIDELFASAALSVSDLNGIVVSLGPGSFTGLRIGLAAAKGIAVARDIPIIGVTMFEVAAVPIGRECALARIVIPSRKDEYYVGVCRDGVVADEDVSIMSEVDLVACVGNDRVYTIGLSPEDFGSDLLKQTACRLDYDAGDVLQVGRDRFLRGERADVATLEPVYLQKAIAEVRFDHRQGVN